MFAPEIIRFARYRLAQLQANVVTKLAEAHHTDTQGLIAELHRRDVELEEERKRFDAARYVHKASSPGGCPYPTQYHAH